MSVTRDKKRKKTNLKDSDWHILIVEDQASIAKMTASMIKSRWNCHVTIASTFQQTKKLLETKASAFFLTVTDLNLPDAPNGEIVDLLLEHKQPIIAITGHFDQSLHEQLKEKGVIDYVLKRNINAYEYLANFVGRLYHNQQMKIMVVDDSEATRTLAGHYLKKQFHNVIYAKNGEEGLERLADNPDIKLVLVDSEMPVMNGLTFTAKARQIKSQTALTIIGISGSSGNELSTQFLKHGANDFISKPFSYEELTCRVNQNLHLLDYIDKMNTVANVDYLTQLPNRRNFFIQGQKLFKQALENETATIVAILDIDHFKSINDQYGHDCGDVVLKHVSRLINDTMETQQVARIGGEEFGFIITASSLTLAEKPLKTLHKQIAQQTIHYAKHELSVTASIGYTAILRGDLDDTLVEADKNLYAAKVGGRNKMVWENSLDQQTKVSATVS